MDITQAVSSKPTDQQQKESLSTHTDTLSKPKLAIIRAKDLPPIVEYPAIWVKANPFCMVNLLWPGETLI